MTSSMPSFSVLSKDQRILLVGQNKGFLTRVARKLGVSQSMVSRVFYSKTTSARVTKALDKEIAEIARAKLAKERAA